MILLQGHSAVYRDWKKRMESEKVSWQVFARVKTKQKQQ